MQTLSDESIIDFIEGIFHRRGADSYLGEAVTMSQHMLQAAQLAENAGADNRLVAATLLHDIGHFTNEFPDDALEHGQNNYHETAGANLLKDFFPPIVIDCIRYHVEAKRYLCATSRTYHQQLSAASMHTLRLQGGAMSNLQVREFAKLPFLQDILNVRRWDDLGKDPTVITPNFAYYRPLLDSIVRQWATNKGKHD